MSQQMQFLIFFTVWCIVVGIGYAYVGWRLVYSASLPSPWNMIAWSALVLLYVLPITSFGMTITRIEHPAVDMLSWGAYTSLAFIVFVLSLLITRDVLLLGWHGIAYAMQLFEDVGSVTPGSGDVMSGGRRLFLMQATDAGIVGGATLMTSVGIFEARRRPGIVEIEVPFPALPDAFDGFRIAQITDLHVGLTIARPFLERAIQQTNDLAPDLVAITGDLVDGTVDHLRPHVEPIKELQAPFGTYFITGNHEYYSGVEPWVDEIRKMGPRVLLNEHAVIEKDGASIILAGVTDHGAGNFLASHISSPERSLKNSPDVAVKILLAHQPKSIYEAARAGFDLMLSGHTHGGQFFPWNYLVALDQPYVSGLHKHENTWVYVSKGTGYWGPPVRLGVRSEITVITLRKKTEVA